MEVLRATDVLRARARNAGGQPRGTTLRTTQPAERKSRDRWFADFVGRLRRDDLAPATVRGYRYDLQQFLRWFSRAKGSSSRLEKLSILDLINYRQHLVSVEALKAATVNHGSGIARRPHQFELQRDVAFDQPVLLRPATEPSQCFKPARTSPRVSNSISITIGQPVHS
jgi:hypothetical protein